MEQHADNDSPQWGHWQRGISVQNVQRETGEEFATKVDHLNSIQMGLLFIIVAIVILVIIPFVLDTKTEKGKGRMPVKVVPEKKFETQAMLFISSVEKLPNVDKYMQFHEDIRKNNKAVAVECSIRAGQRATLYQFQDKSMMEITETWKDGGKEEIYFKAI